MGGLIKSLGTAELGWFPIPVSVRARANITAGTLVEDLRPFGQTSPRCPEAVVPQRARSILTVLAFDEHARILSRGHQTKVTKQSRAGGGPATSGFYPFRTTTLSA